MMFNEDYPLEKYVLSQLRKNKHNIELAVKTIRNKYPFIKSNDLKSIISGVLVKKINNEKISGFWRKIENKWQMVVKADQYSGGSGFAWSGPELPASSDENSMGSARNVYSQPGDRPEGKSPRTNKREVSDIMEVDTSDDDEKARSIAELQKLYDRMMDEYEAYVKTLPERHEIVIEELKESGYGDLVSRLKTKINTKGGE